LILSSIKEEQLSSSFHTLEETFYKILTAHKKNITSNTKNKNISIE